MQTNEDIAAAEKRDNGGDTNAKRSLGHNCNDRAEKGTSYGNLCTCHCTLPQFRNQCRDSILEFAFTQQVKSVEQKQYHDAPEHREHWGIPEKKKRHDHSERTKEQRRISENLSAGVGITKKS